MIYKFKAAYTKLGVGTAPSVAPTCTVVDSDDNMLANAQPTTALTNMTGVYLYSYNGAVGLDLVGRFRTTDATVDQQDLYSYTSHLITTNIDAPISVVDSNVDDIKVDYAHYGDPMTLADDAITAAKFDESTAFPVKLVDTGATKIARVGADGDTLETLSDQIDKVATLGAGAITWTYNLVDALGAAIGNAQIWVTTDAAGTIVIASDITDAFGNATFYLDPGTYYIWGEKPGYNFTNPDLEIV